MPYLQILIESGALLILGQQLRQQKRNGLWNFWRFTKMVDICHTCKLRVKKVIKDIENEYEKDMHFSLKDSNLLILNELKKRLKMARRQTK